MSDPLDQHRDELRRNNCQHCEESQALIVVTAADEVGRVLDSIRLCRDCFDHAQTLSQELEIGNIGTEREFLR
jgi:hypothetical protein